MLNMSLAPGIPSAKGMIAKIIGTAPLKPTHDTYVLSLRVIFLNGKRHRNTVSGRAKNIIKKLIISPGTIIGISSCGFTSKPRVKNIINWKSHAKPSKNLIDDLLCTNLELPITKPPI